MLQRFNIFARLPRPDRRLLAEATMLMAISRLVVGSVPLGPVFTWLGRPLARLSPEPGPICTQVRWAILTASTPKPVQFVGLDQCIAGSLMLRRRGVSSTLHYGVVHSPHGHPVGHAWLEAEGRILLGGEVAGYYTVPSGFAQNPA